MYKHDAIVRAWLDGKPIQFRADNLNDWRDYYPSNNYSIMPSFYTDCEFRIKPKPMIKKYRILMWDKFSKKHVLSNLWYRTQEEWAARPMRSQDYEFVKFIEETLKEEEGDYE